MSVRLDQGTAEDVTRSPRARLDATAGSRAVSGASTLGAGLQQVGASLGDFADEAQRELDIEKREAEQELKQRQAAQNAVRAAELTAQFQIDNAADLQLATENYDGVSDLQMGYAERVAARRDQMLESLGDDEDLKTIVGRQLPGMVARETITAISTEGQLRAAHTAQKIGSTADLMANGVMSGTIDLDVALENVELVAAAAPEARREALYGAAQDKILAAYVEQRVGHDPDSFKQELNDGALDDVMAPSLKARALGAIDTEMKRRAREAEQAQREAARQQALDNRIAAIEQKQYIGSHLQSVAMTGQGVDGVTVAAIARVQGPEAAARFARDEAQAREMYGVMSGIEDLPYGEQVERLEAIKPKAGSPKYEQDFALYQQGLKRIGDIQKQRANDPAAAVLNTDRMRALYEAAQAEDAAPDALSRIVEVSLERQADLGIAPHKRRVLTNQQRQAMIEKIDDPQLSAKQRTAIIAGLSQYGEHKETVLDELVAGGADEALFAMQVFLDDRTAPMDVSGAQIMASAVSNRKALKDTIESDVRSDIADEFGKQLKPLIESYAASPDGSNIAVSYQNDGLLMAQQYAANGYSPKDAAKKAAEHFTRRYDVRGSVRIPRTIADQDDVLSYRYPNSNIEPYIRVTGSDLVVAGMDETLRELIKAGDFYVNKSDEVSSRAAQEAFAAQLRSRGYWVTNREEDGAVLMMRRDTGDEPVLNAKGDSIISPFSALQNAGRDVHMTRLKSAAQREFDLMKDIH